MRSTHHNPTRHIELASPRQPRLAALFAGVLLLGACGGGGGGGSPSPAAPQACSSLTSVTSDSATVTAATMVTSPITVTSPAGTANVTVPFCRVQGVARPSADSEIKFEVWLPPTRAAWNGRMKVEATDGYLGGVPYARMGQMIAQGWVEAGSNLGHDGGESAAWARRPEKVRDYGYRANFFVATAAKAIANAFYAEPVRFSYFDGCSGGGRQAHMMAQRYPQLFDGILAGAPSMFYPDVILEIAWQSRLMYPAASRFPNDPVVPTAKLSMVAARTVQACDANDGLTDGQITDPRSCRFDIGTLACPTGTDGPDCLTAAQLNAVREIRRGSHMSNGAPLWAGPMPGSESVWRGLADTADSRGDGAFIGHTVFNVDGFDWRGINYDTQYSQIKNTLDPLTAAPSPDVSAFRARGGKMVQYHGWNDPLVTPSSSSSYYAAMALLQGAGTDIDKVINELNPSVVANAALLTASVLEHFRLFMVPGMSHCSGGDGPNSFNQNASSPASAADPQHDILAALTRWVEQGVAPDSIIATKYVNNTPASGIQRQRPICAYPTVARYNGTGDVNQASSFSCAVPNVAELAPTEPELVQVRNSLRLRGLLAPTR